MKRIQLYACLICLNGALTFSGCASITGKPSPKATFFETAIVDSGATLFLHRDTLYTLKGQSVRAAGRVGRDPFLSSSGLISSITGKTDHPWMNGSTILIHRYDGNRRIELIKKITLPSKQAVNTTAIARNVLYVSGLLGNHKFGLMEIGLADSVFTPIKIPDELNMDWNVYPKASKNKTFDELLVWRDSLLAVDDITAPKWLVVYDISDPKNPKPVKVIELKTGVNERIIRGIIGPRYLVVLCSSVTMGGAYLTVEFYDPDNRFTSICEVTICSEPWSIPRSNICLIPEMSLQGDLLLLAPWRDGVGVIDCSRIVANWAPMPEELYYLTTQGETLKVRDAVALDSKKEAVIWLKNGEEGFVVSRERLLTKPVKTETRQGGKDGKQ